MYRQVTEAEQASRAVFLSLSGVSLSLINSQQQEVALATLSAAPAMWDVEIKNKWKMLNMELAGWLEEKWQAREAGVVLEDFLEVKIKRQTNFFDFQHVLRMIFRCQCPSFFSHSQFLCPCPKIHMILLKLC